MKSLTTQDKNFQTFCIPTVSSSMQRSPLLWILRINQLTNTERWWKRKARNSPFTKQSSDVALYALLLCFPLLSLKLMQRTFVQYLKRWSRFKILPIHSGCLDWTLWYSRYCLKRTYSKQDICLQRRPFSSQNVFLSKAHKNKLYKEDNFQKLIMVLAW